MRIYVVEIGFSYLKKKNKWKIKGSIFALFLLHFWIVFPSRIAFEDFVLCQCSYFGLPESWSDLW
jgi:hypothetical protein